MGDEASLHSQRLFDSADNEILVILLVAKHAVHVPPSNHLLYAVSKLKGCAHITLEGQCFRTKILRIPSNCGDKCYRRRY
jgi:hypothetical protein